jgi:TfoX/Sxy family transcriptional regulator of competence genes
LLQWAFETLDLNRVQAETDTRNAVLSEEKMFGGVGSLVEGNMAIAASGQGGALVRVDPAESDRLVDTTTAELAVMQGRPMAGWLRLPSESLRTKTQVAKWVRIGTGYAGSLPAKT